MKYMCSKKRFADELSAIINKEIGNKPYYELFVGGLNLTKKIKAKTYILNDINFFLIEYFKKIKEGWTPFEEWDGEDYYTKGELIYRELFSFYRQKYTIKNYSNAFMGYFGFQCCFGGRFFEGFAREKNQKTNFFLNGKKEMEEDIKFIRNNEITFYNLDFSEFKGLKNAVVYLDPPYENTKHYRNTINYSFFWDFVRELSKDNVVFISEENAPSDFDIIWEKEVTKSIMTTVGKSQKRFERLFRMKENKNE